jgi:outer membrane receptor protein involved in Fe transport
LAAAVSILGGTFLCGDIAVAQEARDSNVLDEIIVTARKREERLQEAPLSVSAFSGADLVRMSARDLEDVGRFVPNVMIVEAGQAGGSGLYFIRGIGQQGNADTIRPEPGVAFYIDGVYKSRGQGGVRELLDLERVEVLRGPQGTLFGRNAIGGAINLITKRPTDEYYGYGRVTLGELNTFNVNGKVNLPVTDEFFVSAAAFSSNRDGYFTRLTDGEKLSNVNTDGARVAARWQPNDDLDINFAVDYDRTREDGEGQYLKSILSPAPLMEFHERALIAAGLPTFAMQSREVLGFGHWEGHGNANMQQDGDEWGVMLNIEYAWENITFTSISAYREIEYFVEFEADATTFNFNEQRNFFTKNKRSFAWPALWARTSSSGWRALSSTATRAGRYSIRNCSKIYSPRSRRHPSSRWPHRALKASTTCVRVHRSASSAVRATPLIRGSSLALPGPIQRPAPMRIWLRVGPFLFTVPTMYPIAWGFRRVFVFPPKTRPLRSWSETSRIWAGLSVRVSPPTRLRARPSVTKRATPGTPGRPS